jgi:hypothetical protein
MACNCNPGYSEDRDWEDCNSRPASAESWWVSISINSLVQCVHLSSQLGRKYKQGYCSADHSENKHKTLLEKNKSKMDWEYGSSSRTPNQWQLRCSGWRLTISVLRISDSALSD